MTPPVPAYGSPGCGQRPQDFPLACFELQRQPVQELGLDQLQLAQSRQTRQELRLGASKQAEHDPNATVLWCRKAPPQEGLQQSSSAPSLR
eukprot:g11806.t1